MIWLHAYKYEVPPEIQGEENTGDKKLIIKTKKPLWATIEY